MKCEVEIKDGVKIVRTTDDNGKTRTYFISIETNQTIEQESLFGKIKNWFKKHVVRPYFVVRDLNNSREEPGVNKPKSAAEIGIKMDF